MREEERRAAADAAYDAWRAGGDYDAAWDRAMDAAEGEGNYYDARTAADSAIRAAEAREAERREAEQLAAAEEAYYLDLAQQEAELSARYDSLPRET